jgi:ABC-type multidrug transport system fused ATPase/permease subunit
MQALNGFAIGFLRRNAWRAAAILLAELLANILSIALAVAAAQAVSQLFGYGSARGRWLEALGLAQGPETALPALGGLVALKFAADYGRRRGRGALTEGFLHELRILLFTRHLDLAADQYLSRDSGRFLLRFSGDLTSLQALIQKGFFGFAGDLGLVALGLGVIAWLDAALGLALLLWLLFFAGIIRLLSRRAGVVEEERRNRKSALLAFTARELGHILTIKAFNQRTPAIAQFEKYATKVNRQGLAYHRWAALLEAASQAGVYLALCLALGLTYLRQDTAAADGLLAIALILISWRGALTRLFNVGLIWKKGALSWQKMIILFERPIEQTGAEEPAPGPPSLQLENLRLSDAPNARVFHFTLAAGHTGWLPLGSGAGKTQLAYCLAGLLPPVSGEAMACGLPMRHTPSKAWRRQLTFVSAAFPLRGKTLADAVCYSRSRPHRQKLEALWPQWQDAFPALHGLGPDTPLSQVSGAQYQLLRWLRAFLADKPVWILDDPFSSLPAQSVQTLVGWLAHKARKRAVLLLCSPEALPAHWPPEAAPLTLG